MNEDNEFYSKNSENAAPEEPAYTSPVSEPEPPQTAYGYTEPASQHTAYSNAASAADTPSQKTKREK